MSYRIDEIEAVKQATIYIAGIQTPTLDSFTLNQINFEPDVVFVKQIAYSPAGGLADTSGAYLIVTNLIDSDKNILGSFVSTTTGADATAVATVSNPNNMFLLKKPVNNNNWTIQILTPATAAQGAPLIDAGDHAHGSLTIQLEFIRFKAKDHQKIY